MAYVIFNSAFFEDSICKNMEDYLIDDGMGKKECLNKELLGYVENCLSKSKREQGEYPSLKNVNKTTAQYILGKCMLIITTKKDGSECNVRNMSKYFTNNPAANNRPLEISCAQKVDDYFYDPDTKQNLPLYLDVDQFLKSMMLSSGLLFRSSNLKLCLSVMVDRFKIGHEWTPTDIVNECKKYVDAQRLDEKKIKECLEKYCSREKRTSSLAKSVKAGAPKKMRPDFFEKRMKESEKGKEEVFVLKLTELIAYYNKFLRGINVPEAKTT